MDKLYVLLAVLFIDVTRSLSTCLQYLHRPKPIYHLTKECAISKMRTLASSNATELNSCMKLATEKNAFAFAFTNRTIDLNNTLSATCNVFECPEFHSFLLINNVSVYDYYSIYSKPLPSENFTCAPEIGMFEIITDRLNYSNAMIACEENGGHLANVGSESRTSYLSTLVSSTLINQTMTIRKAFVGLFYENNFVTITGEPLSCLPFRAWAPGHPKIGRIKKDCVVITSTRFWETQDCSMEFPYICELIADGPLTPVERYCAPISNLKRRKKCILRNHRQLEKFDQIKKKCLREET